MTERERHALHLFIAQRVMGWKRVRKLAYPLKHNHFTTEMGNVAVGLDDDGSIHVFRPTLDYAQALTVLEKCCEKKGGLDVEISAPVPDTQIPAMNCWDVYCLDGIGNEWSADAPTLPEAICKFSKALFS